MAALSGVNLRLADLFHNTGSDGITPIDMSAAMTSGTGYCIKLASWTTSEIFCRVDIGN